MRAAALAQAGFALVVLGAPERGHALIDQGLELAHSVDDPRLLVDTLLMAADLRLEAGMPREARSLAGEALDVAREIGDDRTLGYATAIEARACQDELGYEETYRRLARAGEYFERADDRRQVARVALTMAFLSLEWEALDAAESEARRCLAISKELGHPIGQAVATVPEIWVAIERGEPATAGELLARAIVVARESGYVALIGYCVAAGAALRFGKGDLEGAARMLGALQANGDALGGEGGAAISVRVRRLHTELAAALGRQRLAELIAEGARVPLAEQQL
jgi:tetratricopeptide (TPR) repeat protein